MPNADTKPWYVPQRPWAFWGAPSRKKLINNCGNPQNLLAPNERAIGFNPDPNAGFSLGVNATGMGGAIVPATVGNVLNLSAAAMGSGGAFEQRGRPNQ